MEINTWTSTTVLSASQDSKIKIWTVKVEKADGTERVFHVTYVVLATGFKGGKGYVPNYPGTVGLFLKRMFESTDLTCDQESFKGQILHSLEHDKATDHTGKKVVVVGACTSGT